MSDDKTKRAPQDSKRIDMSERYEVHYWSEEFGVSPYELQEAVENLIAAMSAVVDKIHVDYRGGDANYWRTEGIAGGAQSRTARQSPIPFAIDRGKDGTVVTVSRSMMRG